jgi:hypothetical protein
MVKTDDSIYICMLKCTEPSAAILEPLAVLEVAFITFARCEMNECKI